MFAVQQTSYKKLSTKRSKLFTVAALPTGAAGGFWPLDMPIDKGARPLVQTKRGVHAAERYLRCTFSD